MENVENLDLALHRVNVLGWQNVAVVYSYTSKIDGKTRYAIFQYWDVAQRWMKDTQLDVERVFTAEEGWTDEG